MPNIQNCWEIMKCGREKGGSKVFEFGECIASKEQLGHSCWVIAGTLCGGVVQGKMAQKLLTCLTCPLYKGYSRTAGSYGKEVQTAFPDEERKYRKVVFAALRAASTRSASH